MCPIRKKIMKKIILYLLIITLSSCAYLRKLQKEKYHPLYCDVKREFKDNNVFFYLKNPAQCPINIKLRKDNLNPNIDKLFGTIILKELQDTIIKIKYPQFQKNSVTKYVINYGDFNKKIIKNKIDYPFPKRKKYKIIQGYNGKFTHNKITSKYAIDFNLKIGDTITCVDNGYVVGVIEDYKKYGLSKKWLENDKSNYITIYHPHSGLFTQYVHLDYKGSLVKLGQYVKQGQPIAISGMTGFTTEPHLHFNVKIPTKENGLISTNIEFINGVKGSELKRNKIVKK